MATYKRYITIQPLHKLNIEVKVGKKYVRVMFSNGGTTNGGSATYTTSDEALQKALESTSMFGKVYRLQSSHQEVIPTVNEEPSVSDDAPETPEEQQKDESVSPKAAKGPSKEPIRFSTYNELRDWLVSEHGCIPAEVRTTDAALAKAAALNLNVILEK